MLEYWAIEVVKKKSKKVVKFRKFDFVGKGCYKYNVGFRFFVRIEYNMVFFYVYIFNNVFFFFLIYCNYFFFLEMVVFGINERLLFIDLVRAIYIRLDGIFVDYRVEELVI